MIDELTREFGERFGRPPEAAARAPGRVNLIGEHTDYNEGLVLPFAIDRDTIACVARRSDSWVRVYSREQSEEGSFRVGTFERLGEWTDYVSGVIHAFLLADHSILGLDIGIASQVPVGSGLSSSAALCVSLATAIDAVFGMGLSAIERARIAHLAESELVGIGCGVLDPFASALGGPDCAVRIDCRSQAVEPVPLPTDLCLLVADSGVQRALATAGYRERVSECAEALATAVAKGIAPADATALRDLSLRDLEALGSVLPANQFRRVRHVLSENERVDATCAALRAGDRVAVGDLLRRGMRSLRDDYQVSTPELDRLCEVADATPGVFGSRLTGAGFGGCTIHLLDPAALDDVRRVLAPHTPRTFAVHPAAPASPLFVRHG